MSMLSGDKETRFLFTTCPERENNRSYGTVVAGEAKYLKATLATKPCDGAHFRHHSNGHKFLSMILSANTPLGHVLGKPFLYGGCLSREVHLLCS